LGTGLRQLELADEYDELVSALMGQLLRSTVFGAQGLFSNHRPIASTSTPDGGDPPPGIDIDGDGINDVLINGGEYTCVFDGTYPNCQGSREAAANSGTIWGYVFNDTNRNGTQDSGEQGVGNVPVRLTNASTTEEARTNITYNGIYTFGQLRNGEAYIVGIEVPSGYTLIGPNDVSITATALVPNRPVKNFGIIAQ